MPPRAKFEPEAAPAVVLNPDVAGIGIIHSLGPQGVPIVTVERRWPPTLGRFSRFVRRSYGYWPQRESLAECLLRIAPDFAPLRPVLFPSTDQDLEELVRAHGELAAHYEVPASAAIGLRIFEKNWQYQLARRTGVDTPAHALFRGGQEPDIRGFRFPLIVKPSSRAASTGRRVFRLRVVENSDQWLRLLQEIARDHPGREFQVAENIPGEPDELYTVGSYSDRSGRVLRSFTGRKRTQHPYTHGMASVAESVPLPESVVSAARRLLEEARFHGISQVEFKRDARDGRYKLLEVNGRAWLWIKLSAFSGLNLPLIQYYDLTGDPRLAQALSGEQRFDTFFVHDFHVRLNDMPEERALIAELARTKQLVPAMTHAGEWRLDAAYRIHSALRRWRRQAA